MSEAGIHMHALMSCHRLSGAGMHFLVGSVFQVGMQRKV